MSFRVTERFDGSDSEKCMSLELGDALTNVHILDNDWYIGYNERTLQTGVFPKSCVTPTDEGHSPLPGKLVKAGNLHEKVIYANVSKQIEAEKNKDKIKVPAAHQQVRFSDVRLEHSISVPDSETSWQDSSFEDSFRDKLANYDTVDDDIKPQQTNIDETNENGNNDENEDRSQNMFSHIMASTERLFRSKKDENKRLKSIFGVLFGLAIGVIFFLLSVFSFDYSFVDAAILISIFTVLISLGLAFSTHCRCVMALVFPSFVTGKGRALLLSIIFSLMLTHPFANIAFNVEQTGSSMACIVDIAANHSRQLQKKLATPLVELAEYIDQQQKEMKVISSSIRDGFSDVRSALDTADQGVQDAKKSIDAIKQTCISRIESTKQACNSKCPAFIGCGGLCGAFNNVKQSCSGFQLTDNALTEAARNARSAIDETVAYFGVDIQIHGEFNASANTSRSLTDMQGEVEKDIGEKVDALTAIVRVLNKFLSLSLLLLFLQSFWYLRNYLAKDAYDNIYITTQFKKLDTENKKNGRETILPLKKNEEDKYVYTSSWMLCSCELSHCKIGFLILLLHLLLFIMVLIFDVSLWYILDLVKGYGDIDLSVEGGGRITVKVDGKGPVSDFYRILIKGLNVNQNYSADVDIGACLPDPKMPSYEMYPIYIILYIVTGCCVVFQGYGLRLRRKICSYYYPEQEHARLDYLHKKIRHKRIGFLKFLRQQILSSHKEEQVKNQLRFSTWLAFRCPILARLIPEESKLECTSCEQSENSFNHIQVTQCMGKSGGIRCEAAYCEECWKVLSNSCPLCQTDEVMLRN